MKRIPGWAAALACAGIVICLAAACIVHRVPMHELQRIGNTSLRMYPGAVILIERNGTEALNEPWEESSRKLLQADEVFRLLQRSLNPRFDRYHSPLLAMSRPGDTYFRVIHIHEIVLDEFYDRTTGRRFPVWEVWGSADLYYTAAYVKRYPDRPYEKMNHLHHDYELIMVLDAVTGETVPWGKA